MKYIFKDIITNKIITITADNPTSAVQKINSITAWWEFIDKK